MNVYKNECFFEISEYCIKMKLLIYYLFDMDIYSFSI